MEDKKQIAVAIVTNEQGQVLMIRRLEEEKSDDGTPLTWVFPGGYPEKGETLERAAIREVLLETGFLVSVEKKISSRIHPQFPVEIHYFAGKIISKNPLRGITETEEVGEFRWVDPGEIKKLITTDLDPGVAFFLEVK